MKSNGSSTMSVDDVARDGRFVMIEPPGGGADAPAASIVVVQNFVEELQRRVQPSAK